MQVGELVISTRGRDTGEYFLVCEVCDEYLYLVDGNIRKLQKPKKKKAKHTKTTNFVHEGLSQKFLEHKQVHDKEVFSAIRKWKEENQHVER